MSLQLATDPDLLRFNFESSAEWRRAWARQHPNDNRYSDAVKILDRLAATVGDVDPTFINAYSELFDDCTDSEHQGEMLRAVGFHYFPKDATEFVKDFIAARTAGQ